MILGNVRGYCRGGHHIVRLLDTPGVWIYDTVECLEEFGVGLTHAQVGQLRVLLERKNGGTAPVAGKAVD